MRGRLAAVVLSIVLSGLCFGACGPAHAAGEADSAIAVMGDGHVDAATIRSYFHAAPDGTIRQTLVP